MGEVIDLNKNKESGKYEIDYYKDEGGQVFAISSPDWPFRIQRNGDEIAFVADDNDEPFGILDRDVFNTVLACWLIVDAPHILGQ